MDAIEIESQLLDALARDQIVLPTLPEIALKVQDAANNPNTDIKTLTDLVCSDTALSARIVKVANSPLVRGLQLIDDLPAAIRRLGIIYSCNLAVGLAMEQVFQATNEMVDRRMREVWAQSAEVAGIAAVLARHYTNLQSEQATLAGLVHLIGVLPILTYCEENDLLSGDKTQDALLLDNLISSLSPALGTKILETWSFPEALIQVPSLHANYEREADEPDYVDIIIVAKLQSYEAGKLEDGTLDWHQVSAFSRLGLDGGSENMELEDLSEEFTKASDALQ